MDAKERAAKISGLLKKNRFRRGGKEGGNGGRRIKSGRGKERGGGRSVAGGRKEGSEGNGRGRLSSSHEVIDENFLLQTGRSRGEVGCIRNGARGNIARSRGEEGGRSLGNISGCGEPSAAIS